MSFVQFILPCIIVDILTSSMCYKAIGSTVLILSTVNVISSPKLTLHNSQYMRKISEHLLMEPNLLWPVIEDTPLFSKGKWSTVTYCGHINCCMTALKATKHCMQQVNFKRSHGIIFFYFR